MNQSAVYRSSKRALDQVEADFPVKKLRLRSIVTHSVVCRFLKGRNSPPVFLPKSPGNKAPVIVANSPVDKAPVIVANSPVDKAPVIVPKSPVNKPPVTVQRYDEETSELEKKATQLLLNGRIATFKSRRITEDSIPIATQMSYMFSDENMRYSVRRRLEAEREAETRGYTGREFDLCRVYLFKRNFEKSSEPVPREYRYFKEYLDQIRDTRGYGLNVGRSWVEDDPEILEILTLKCIFHGWEKDPKVQKYVKKMEEMVLAKIQEKTGKAYECAGLVNLVRSNYIRLVTFHVHQKGTLPNDAQPREVAEAFFLMLPIAPILENIDLQELKLRRGEQVLFSTGETLKASS